MGVSQRRGVYDNGSQLSYAASRHSGLNVLGPYKSENVFHELNKPWSIISITLWYSIKTVVFIRYLRDATQTFREFEYTAQTMSATNLLRSVPLAVSFNLQSAYWLLYKCTCFWALAVFFMLFSCVSANIKMANVKEQKFALNFASSSTKLQLKPTKMLK